MSKEVNSKPLTIKHIREVLIPAMEKVFATKQELKGLEFRFDKKFSESLSKQDEILAKLDTLLQEKTFADAQTKRQRKLRKIMVDAARQGKPLSPSQVQKIKQLGIV